MFVLHWLLSQRKSPCCEQQTGAKWKSLCSMWNVESLLSLQSHNSWFSAWSFDRLHNRISSSDLKRERAWLSSFSRHSNALLCSALCSSLCSDVVCQGTKSPEHMRKNKRNIRGTAHNHIPSHHEAFSPALPSPTAGCSACLHLARPLPNPEQVHHDNRGILFRKSECQIGNVSVITHCKSE